MIQALSDFWQTYIAPIRPVVGIVFATILIYAIYAHIRSSHYKSLLSHSPLNKIDDLIKFNVNHENARLRARLDELLPEFTEKIGEIYLNSLYDKTMPLIYLASYVYENNDNEIGRQFLKESIPDFYDLVEEIAIESREENPS